MSNGVFKHSVGYQLATALLCAALAACGGGGKLPTDSQTVVGGVSASSDETLAQQARFNAPKGVARDAGGNLYVVDSTNATIRRIAASGAVTTIAGTPGVTGSADGVGAAARFTRPSNIAIDAAGNLYVADTGNHTIRKITPSGAVSTLAGSAGVRGDADGVGAAAQFSQPWGIAVDASGNVYVADTNNYLIRKITPSGAVSTFAGTRGVAGNTNGSAASATFRGPRGLAFDGAGNLYVADWFGPPAPAFAETSTIIRKITPSGEVSALAGTTGRDGVEPMFSDAWAITADAVGNVYVADHQRVRKITPAGAVSTLADSAQFTSLQGAAVDAAGNLYVADESRHFIAKVTQGGEIGVFAGAMDRSGSVDATQ